MTELSSGLIDRFKKCCVAINDEDIQRCQWLTEVTGFEWKPKVELNSSWVFEVNYRAYLDHIKDDKEQIETVKAIRSELFDVMSRAPGRELPMFFDHERFSLRQFLSPTKEERRYLQLDADEYEEARRKIESLKLGELRSRLDHVIDAAVG